MLKLGNLGRKGNQARHRPDSRGDAKYDLNNLYRVFDRFLQNAGTASVFRRRAKLYSSTRELPPFGPVYKAHILVKILALSALVGFCFLYGGAFALLVPYLVYPLVIPVAFLLGVVLWAMPESAKAPIGWIEPLLFAFLVGLIMWPNYLALAIPGIPRITILRLTGVPLAVCLLMCLAASTEFRSTIANSIKAAKSVGWLIFAFTVIQVVSVFWSTNKGASINSLLNVAISWVFIYLAAVFVTSKSGVAEKIAAYICIMSVGLVFIGVWEERLNHLPWLGHIPSFLQINDPTVERILAGTARQGKGHRIQTTFSTSLSLSEYFALSMPFLFHFAVNKYQSATRIAATAAVPLVVFATLLTQSRTGLLGIAITVLLYPIILAYLYWRKNRASLVASALILLSPVMLIFGVAAALVVPAIRIRLLGGGAESYSNDARKVQLSMGIPKLLHHPWGYGIGQGAETLGFTNAAGMLTIDSYPLRLALEYGILGLIIWFLIYGLSVWSGIRALLSRADPDRDYWLLAPISVALASFVAMKINLAQEDNEPVLYLLLGAMTSLIARPPAPAQVGKSTPALVRSEF